MDALVATLKGSQDRRDVKIDTFPFVIGRCRTANFIIPHINVSRNHCHIIRENLLWKAIDYSSSGTYVNNELIGKKKSRILKSGDVIRFGSVENNLCWTFSVSNGSVSESEQREGFSSGTNTIKDHTKDNTINKTFPTVANKEGNKTNEAHQELRKEAELRVPTITYGFSPCLKPNESHFGSTEKGCGKIITEPENCEIEIIDCKLSERKHNVKTERVYNKNENNEFQLNSNITEEKLKLKAKSCENQANTTGEKSNLQKEDLQNTLFVPGKNENENEKNKIKCYLPKPSVRKGSLKNLPQKSVETNATKAQCVSKYLLEKDQEKVLDDKYSCLPKRARMETDVKLEMEQSRSQKTKELMKELEQLKSALNDLECKNSALEGELAAVSNCKNEALQYQSDLLGNLANLMEDELQCTICSELFVQAVTLGCTHTFCQFCIDQWRKKQKTCPICRKRIISETRSLVVDNYIDKMVGNLSHKLKERREAIIAERN